ncbi:hypothetical protein BHM03_00059147 [Ensete ventricosum]|uniref:Uncharacterized protein n=1 Tax=Ensete ventricosum TaxID=4639 RepID=A0A445MMN6_ENSVE|nr:hypothetical protein BHM03_00059147 [Ensete ventricosum]
MVESRPLGRTRGTHPSGRAPTPSRDDHERASAQGLDPAVLTQWIRRQAESTGQAPDLTLTFLALEGGPISQERPFGNSGAEHHLKPNHPQPTEEATVAIRERGLLKAPNPMKSHPERRDKKRYCRFQKEYRHDTEECHDLQYQIEDLIQRGHLRRYVREQSSLPDGRPPETRHPDPKARSRSKSTSSSVGQPRAVTAPRHKKLMRDPRSGRGRCMMSLTYPFHSVGTP